MTSGTQVVYNSEGFLEKNRDTLSRNVSELLGSSSHSLIRQLFKQDSADRCVAKILSVACVRGVRVCCIAFS